jgi:hypothetical protein
VGSAQPAPRRSPHCGKLLNTGVTEVWVAVFELE